MSRVIFKTDHQNQFSLFPYSFDHFVEENHPARLIDQIVDNLEITEILRTYKGGGSSSYHPRMLLKVIIYGYLNNLYSSRKIAKAIKENVSFMWLSGQQFPDYRTINNFRGKRLKGHIDEIFKQVVLFLQAQGLVSLEEVFTDGTKIESVANRYTFVWRKSVERYKEKLESKIHAVLAEIDKAIEEDETAILKEQTQQEVTPLLSAQEINEKVAEINQKLKDKNTPKTLKKKVEKLQKDSLPKLQKYEMQLNIMGKRNSYSKTDKDATFMRMKEDHMKNGQLKPAYNVQVSTENNFITNYTIHQNPGDTTTFKDHLNKFNEKYNKYPARSVADAGYGGLENYDFLEEKGIDNFVKYNYFYKEQTKKFKTDISKVENLHYNKQWDCFICPMGQKMRPIETSTRKTLSQYPYQVTIYQAENCSRCPLRGACHKQKGNRRIEINKRLLYHKDKARENLNSQLGKELRGRRNSEVEQTFGQLKSNKGFKRFLLKSIPKVSVEFGLLSLAHNFQKLHKYLCECDFDKILAFYQFIIYKIWAYIVKLGFEKTKSEYRNIVNLKSEILKKAA